MIKRLIRIKTLERLIDENLIFEDPGQYMTRDDEILSINLLELLGRKIYIDLGILDKKIHYEYNGRNLFINFDWIDINDYIDNFDYDINHFASNIDSDMLWDFYNLFVEINNAVYDISKRYFIIPQKELLLIESNEYEINVPIIHDYNYKTYIMFPHLKFYNGKLTEFDLTLEGSSSSLRRQDILNMLGVYSKFDSLFNNFLHRTNIVDYNENYSISL